MRRAPEPSAGQAARATPTPRAEEPCWQNPANAARACAKPMPISYLGPKTPNPLMPTRAHLRPFNQAAAASQFLRRTAPTAGGLFWALHRLGEHRARVSDSAPTHPMTVRSSFANISNRLQVRSRKTYECQRSSVPLCPLLRLGRAECRMRTLCEAFSLCHRDVPETGAGCAIPGIQLAAGPSMCFEIYAQLGQFNPPRMLRLCFLSGIACPFSITAR